MPKQTKSSDAQPGATKDRRKPGEKRAYQPPAFRFEQVFETMALACGKISATQGSCRFNRKSS